MGHDAIARIQAPHDFDVVGRPWADPHFGKRHQIVASDLEDVRPRVAPDQRLERNGQRELALDRDLHACEHAGLQMRVAGQRDADRTQAGLGVDDRRNDSDGSLLGRAGRSENSCGLPGPGGEQIQLEHAGIDLDAVVLNETEHLDSRLDHLAYRHGSGCDHACGRSDDDRLPVPRFGFLELRLCGLQLCFRRLDERLALLDHLRTDHS